MRKFTLTLTLLTVFAGAYAQNYWVVETKGRATKESIVKIYDVNNNIIRESKVNRLIDINKSKERKRLNRMLRESNPVLWSKR
jgi:hypothetical protein